MNELGVFDPASFDSLDRVSNVSFVGEIGNKLVLVILVAGGPEKLARLSKNT